MHFIPRLQTTYVLVFNAMRSHLNVHMSCSGKVGIVLEDVADVTLVCSRSACARAVGLVRSVALVS